MEQISSPEPPTPEPPSSEPPTPERIDLTKDSDHDSSEDSDAEHPESSDDPDAPEDVKIMKAKVKRLREWVATKKRKCQEVALEVKRLRRLVSAQEEVRRLHRNIADCAEDAESPWRSVGEEITESITVPCEDLVTRNDTCTLKCTHYFKDVLHELFGVQRAGQPFDKCAFKLVAASKRHRCFR